MLAAIAAATQEAVNNHIDDIMLTPDNQRSAGSASQD
jgi:hypothetical protein